MHASDPTFPLYPILSFLAIIVSFIPFPWHFRARNVGTCSYMLSTGSLAIVGFINSIIWKDNVDNVAPVWCDITAQVIILANAGLTASTLAISRQLYNISIINGGSKTPKEKRRDMIINCLIALGIPILVMGLHFIVQPRRFDIFEEVGCQPATFNTVTAYILYFSWPILIGLCSFVYSVLTLRNFYTHRVQFAKVATNGSGMSPSRYIRLMLLVFVDMICNTPIGVFLIIVASRAAVLPFSTLSKTVDFSNVEFVTAAEWNANPLSGAAVQLGRWVPPIFCSFVFFAFFGFSEEARKNYKKLYENMKKLFGRGQRTTEMDTPKPKSKVWSMIASSARSPSATESTIALSTKSMYLGNDKYTPDGSYLSQTDTLNSPYSPYSPPSCASSLRPLLTVARANANSPQPSSRQASFVDTERRAGSFAAQIQAEAPRTIHRSSNSLSAASTVAFNPSALENGYAHGQGRSEADGLEEIPLDWSPAKASTSPSVDDQRRS